MIMRAKSSGKLASAKSEKKTGKFVYKKTDPKKIHERANQSGGQFDGILKSGVDSWRPAEGDNTIRILPATWEPHDHYGFDVWAHERVGVDKGTYPCLAKMKKKRCPICEMVAECQEAGEDEDAKAMMAKRKVVCYIIDRDDDKPIPKIYVMSWTMDRDITALCENKKTGKVLYIDHPDDGYDVSFKRKGTNLNTRYIGVSIDREASAISESTKTQDSIMEFLQENPVPSVIKYYDEKYLEQIIQGKGKDKDEELDEDEDGDEDEAPRSKKTKTKRRPSDEDESEDDDPPFDADAEDAEDPDEDDAEEEQPKKKGKVKRRPSEDDESEDEDASEDDEDADAEDPDEDDEEEQPKKRRRPRDEEDDEEASEDEDDNDTNEDEDADDDEEEEDEAPKRRPGKVKRNRR